MRFPLIEISKNYDRIASVMKNQTISNQIATWQGQAYPLGDELRIIMAAISTRDHGVIYGRTHSDFRRKQFEDQWRLYGAGYYRYAFAGHDKRKSQGIKDPASILLSESAARDLFGDKHPMGRPIKIDNKMDAVVTGVYKDLPLNSSFSDLHFIAPWQLIVSAEHYDTRFNNPWGASWFLTYVQIADHADMNSVSEKIREAELKQITNNDDIRFNHFFSFIR